MAINIFLSLGKGFYLAMCASKDLVYGLVCKGGLLSFFPMWVTLNAMSVFLRKQIHVVATALSRVLFVPMFFRFLEHGKSHPFFVDIDWGLSSFPNSCYQCRKLGHFARDRTGKPQSLKKQEENLMKEEASSATQLGNEVEWKKVKKRCGLSSWLSCFGQGFREHHSEDASEEGEKMVVAEVKSARVLPCYDATLRKFRIPTKVMVIKGVNALKF